MLQCLINWRHLANAESVATAIWNADFLKSRIKFYLNVKVTQWPWNVKLTLSQHCSPVGTMPNKYMAKITIKMRKSKMLDFSMKILPWPKGQGQMVQWELMCIFPQAFQMIKPGVDISSNGWDIVIYMKNDLDLNVKVNASKCRIFSAYIERPFRVIHKYIKLV